MTALSGATKTLLLLLLEEDTAAAGQPVEGMHYHRMIDPAIFTGRAER